MWLKLVFLILFWGGDHSWSVGDIQISKFTALQNELKSSPKHWFSNLKVVLFRTVRTFKWELRFATKNTDSLVCSRNNILRQTMSLSNVLQTGKQISIHRILDENQINKQVWATVGKVTCSPSNFHQTHLPIGWTFELHSKLGLNITFEHINLIMRQHCWQQFVSINNYHQHQHFRFCAEVSAFSFYTNWRITEILCKLSGASRKFLIQFLFSVTDRGVIVSEYPVSYLAENTKKPRLTSVHKIPSANISICTFLIEVSKTRQLTLNVFQCHSDWLQVFDGPGPLSETLKPQGKILQASSFQAVFQILTKYSSNANRDICALNYISRTLGTEWSLKSFVSKLVVNTKCKRNPCVAIVSAPKALHVNLTVISVKYQSKGTLSCRYGGFCYFENFTHFKEECLCSNHSFTLSPSRSFYSKLSQLQVVLFWYKAYTNVEVSVNLSTSNCTPVVIDICFTKFCQQNVSECRQILASLAQTNDLEIDFNGNLLDNTDTFLPSRETLSIFQHLFQGIEIQSKGRSCIVVQLRDFNFPSATLCQLHISSLLNNSAPTNVTIVGDYESPLNILNRADDIKEFCFVENTTVHCTNEVDRGLGKQSSFVFKQSFQRRKSQDILTFNLFLGKGEWIDIIWKGNLQSVASPCEEVPVTSRRYAVMLKHMSNDSVPAMLVRITYHNSTPLPLPRPLACLITSRLVGAVVYLHVSRIKPDTLVRTHIELPEIPYLIEGLPGCAEFEKVFSICVAWSPPKPGLGVYSFKEPKRCNISNMLYKSIHCGNISFSEQQASAPAVSRKMKSYFLLFQTDDSFSWSEADKTCHEEGGGLQLPCFYGDRDLQEFLCLLHDLYPTVVLEALFMGLVFQQVRMSETHTHKASHTDTYTLTHIMSLVSTKFKASIENESNPQNSIFS